MDADILLTLPLGVPQDGVLDRTDAFAIAALDSVTDGELITGLMLTMRPVELNIDSRHRRAAVGCHSHRDTSIDRNASRDATGRVGGSGTSASGGNTTTGKIRENTGQRSGVPRTTSRQRTALWAEVKECMEPGGISTTALASNLECGAALTS
jgi:hypothetical protein